MYLGHKRRSIDLATYALPAGIWCLSDSIAIFHDRHRQPISIVGIEKDNGRMSLQREILAQMLDNNTMCFIAIGDASITSHI